MSNKEELEKAWKVKSIHIYLRDKGYGEDKTYYYTGSVEFENGEDNSFKFSFKEDVAERYIKLIADDVVEGARILGESVANSIVAQFNISKDNDYEKD